MCTRGADISDYPGGMNACPNTILRSNHVVTQLVSQGYGSCVLYDDYQAQCWGLNGSGGLGIGDTTDRGSVASTMGDALPLVSW